MRSFPLAALLAACSSNPGFSLVINVEDSPHEGRLGELVEIKLRAEGGVEPIVWSRVGSIPGVALDDEGGIDAALRGRPEMTGRFSVIVNAQDDTNNAGLAAVDLLVKDAAVPPGPPVIKTESIPLAVIGLPYRAKIELRTGSEPLTWNAAGMPDALAFDRDLHAIEGVALIEGRFEITVRVEDDSRRMDEATYQLDALPMLFIIGPVLLPEGSIGTPYDFAPEASGGRPPYSWRVASNWLPDGLAIVDGAITGTPSVAGRFDFSLEVTDTSSQSAVAGATILIR